MPFNPTLLFGQGYGIGTMVECKPLDLGVSERAKNPKHMKDLFSMTSKFLVAIASACHDFGYMIQDIRLLDGRWQMREARLFLLCVSWHVDCAFAQTMNVIREEIISRCLVVEGRLMFQDEAVLEAFQNGYKEAEIALLETNKALDAAFATSQTFLEDNFDLHMERYEIKTTRQIPALCPLEFFVEVVRRNLQFRVSNPTGLLGMFISKRGRSGDVHATNSKIEAVERDSEIRRLKTVAMGRKEHATRGGRPRVFCLSVNLVPQGPKAEPTVIRSTRPAWESFRPMRRRVEAMRYSLIADHQPYMSEVIRKHRQEIADSQVRLHGRVLNNGDDEDLEKTKPTRQSVANNWHNQPRSYHRYRFDMLAGAYSGFDFSFVPRCFSCRALFTAQIYRGEKNDLKAWTMSDYEDNNLSLVGGIVGVKDHTKCGKCAEWWVSVENWRMIYGDVVPTI